MTGSLIPGSLKARNPVHSRRDRWTFLLLAAFWLIGAGNSRADEPQLPAIAEWEFTQLKSFGDPERDATYPQSGVTLASDGIIYATTWANDGTLYRVAQDGRYFRVLHRFGKTLDDGLSPRSRPIEGSDGMLYGLTEFGGGENSAGTVYCINRDGTDYRILHRFGPTGILPQADLIEASDGMLYGATLHGGEKGGGVLFRLARDGSGFELLHEFTPYSEDSSFPRAGLLEASDGMLYGTASGSAFGSSFYDPGTVFRLNRDGTGFQVIHRFSVERNEGWRPQAELTEGHDGALYGTTFWGGTGSYGTVFRVNKDGSDYRVIHHFEWRHRIQGVEPSGSVVLGPGGLLYGFARHGGRNGPGGTAYVMDRTGAFHLTLHSFGNHLMDAMYPLATPAITHGGTLFGVAQGGNSSLGAIFRVTPGKRADIILNFTRGGGDGVYPNSMIATDKMLYGTTENGGSFDYGTLFEMAPDGTRYKKLWNFMGGRHGAHPQGVTVDSKGGTLFGVTRIGGRHNQGTLFRLTRDGRYSVLRHFRGYPEDGESPTPAPIVGSDGRLYGVTEAGGEFGYGTVYRVNKDGSGYGILLHFSDFNIGNPGCRLLEGSDGILYGVGNGGDGHVFKINKDGSGFEVIHQFDSWENGSQGYYPNSALIECADGLLYGTTESSLDYNAGVLFRLNRDGTGYSVLHVFEDRLPSRATPLLVEGADGKLYGDDGQSVFRISKTGAEFEILHQFISEIPGLGPGPISLVKTADGEILGITQEGGDLNYGTLFKLNPVQ